MLAIISEFTVVGYFITANHKLFTTVNQVSQSVSTPQYGESPIIICNFRVNLGCIGNNLFRKVLEL